VGLNAASYLREHSQTQPDTVALRFPATAYSTAAPRWDAVTYRELEAWSDELARGFAQFGISAGEKTLILAKPSLEFYAMLFGLMKVGAVPILLDPGMGLRNLLKCIAQTRPVAMVALTAVHIIASIIRSPFKSVRRKITVGPRLFWGGRRLEHCRVTGDSPVELAALDPDDKMAIVFTSGSTGAPKGVVWTQELFRAQVSSVQQMLDMGPGITQVQCFAAFAMQDICWGHTCVIPKMNLAKPATAKPADVVAAIVEHQADSAFASPIVWINLGPYCRTRGIQLHSLNKAITTGAPIPVNVHRQYREILDEGTQFWTPYGATEAIPVTHIATDEILGDTHEKTKKGAGTCVGWPAVGAEVQIIGITEEAISTWSDDLALAQGEIGEIVVRGPQVSREYYECPEANAKAKIQSDAGVMHRMGDLGYFDEKGRLWFCGRKAHRLETVHGLVPAVSVEGIFNDHPKVFRTALVGVGVRGQENPILCVQPKKGVSSWKDEDVAELLQRAAGTRWEGVVAAVLVHKNFPTDARHNSKIRREDLKVWATSQRWNRQIGVRT
jgi:acyl-CoA synthetase (AMP-forming)/AMP-acid ligase II